jgi:penicillin-binding protein 1A
MVKSITYIKASLIILIVILVVIVGLCVGVSIGYYTSLPDVINLESIPPSLITKIYSEDDQVIKEFSQEYRIIVSFDQVPAKMIDALISAEDSNFFNHWGIDPKGMVRALFKNIKSGEISQGGSTITQQLAKVLLLNPEKKIKRKISEIFLALEIEKRYSKIQILELYFNWIFFGHNYYGIGAAAKGYFNKTLDQLTTSECALIAGLVRSPNRYSPFKNFNKALERRNFVLKRMLKDNKITKDEYMSAVSETLNIAPYQREYYDETYYIERVRKYLEKKYGADAIYTKGLEVHTTLDMELQDTAVAAVKDGLEKIKAQNANSKTFREAKGKLQAALIAIENKTGKIKAYVGGDDFSTSKFDCVYQAQRQAGSSFKPIIFASAIEHNFKPTDKIYDSPIQYEDPSIPGPWSPDNYDGEFHGLVTLRTILEKSINVATVKLLEKLGPANAIKTAKQLGIKSRLTPYLSLGLGAFEINLEEMASAFSTFANQGVRVEPTFMRFISDPNGKLLEEGKIDAYEAISPQIAYQTNYLMQGVIKSGTGKAASKLNAHLGGKTGTTNEFHDAWFIGFSPYITVGVWVGREVGLEPIGYKATGAVAALPIWIQFMESALKKYPDNDFEIPNGITFIKICKEDGCVPRGYCDDLIDEAFITGNEKVPFCN